MKLDVTIIKQKVLKTCGNQEGLAEVVVEEGGEDFGSFFRCGVVMADDREYKKHFGRTRNYSRTKPG